MNVKFGSLAKLLGYYLIPGVFIALGYYIISPRLLSFNLSSIFTLSILIAVVLIPIQGGYLLCKRTSKKDKTLLSEILAEQKHIHPKKFILYVIILIVFTGIVFALLGNTITPLLKDRVFTWIPKWARYPNIPSLEPQQTVTIITLLLFGNILGPLVEEVYFRGYLLNKTPGSPIVKSIINAFLFALYHFWSPWDIITRTIAVVPYAFITLKTKNIWIAIVAHIGVNMISTISILILLF